MRINHITYTAEYPPVKYIDTLWTDAKYLRMNIVNAILLITKHQESKYGDYYTDSVIDKVALNPRTVLEARGDMLEYIIYGLNERLKGKLPVQVIDDLIYGEIDAEEARKRCSEYLDSFETDEEDLEESTRIGLKEARKILEAKGCRLLKEYNGAMSILIRTINKVMAENNIDGTVEETEIDTDINPLGTLSVTLEGAEKPYIIGYAENATGGYVVFNCIGNGDTKVCKPVGDACYSRAETYNRIVDEVTKYIQKYADVTDYIQNYVLGGV